MLNISRYIKDPVLLQRLQKMDKAKQQTICEIICGSIVKHSFYVSKKKNTKAKLTDLDNVPYIYTVSGLPKQLSDYIQMNQHIIGGHAKFSWKSDFLGEASVNIPVSEYTEHLFRNMIEEKNSFKDIFKAMEKDMGKKIKNSDLTKEINAVFPLLEEVGLLLLRNKKIDIKSWI